MPSSDNRSRAPVEKSLPHNLEAERSILGAILLDNSCLDRLLHMGFPATHFFLPEHKRIFSGMLALREKQQAIDLVTLTEHFGKRGEIELIGGAGYLASLVDGMPRVSNVGHYATIVTEKSILRQIIRTADAAQRLAIEGPNGEDQDAAGIYDTVLRSFSAIAENVTTKNGHKLRDVDIRDFLTMTFDPQQFIIEPILPLRGSGMIYSPAGAGKTYIGLYMAYCIALGYDHCFVWDVPAARRVLYVDGEMDKETMQRRQQEIARGFAPALPEPGFFRLITPDLQEREAPRINTKEGRAMIEDRIRDAALLFLDNLETLCPTGDEKSTDYWAEVQEWILALRRKGVGTVWFHHAGKSGAQLGTSKKEHQLYFNLTLRMPKNYQMEEGLRVIAKLEKIRGRGRDNFNPAWAQPFEISLTTELDGENTKATFLHRPARDLLRQQAIQMLQSGMHPGDIAADLGLDRWTIYRLKKKVRDSGIAAAEADQT
jgi:hypothetical protein